MSNNHYQIYSNHFSRYKSLEIHRITELQIEDAKPHYTT